MLWIVNQHEEQRALSLEQIKTFVTGYEEIEFEAENAKEVFSWTQATLCGRDYSGLARGGR